MKTTPKKYIVEGRIPLKGTVTVSGSKNATLPILCAALLSDKPSVIHNVPDIVDVRNMLKIFETLNVKYEFKDNTVHINASGLSNKEMPEKLISSMRASILLIGPLLARTKEIRMPFPGGCVLGKRPVVGHTNAFEELGVDVLDEVYSLHLKVNRLEGATITMPEMSVTGTENAVMLASVTSGKTEIRLAAAEPHVQDLCNFLNSMGAKITGIGSHFLTIEGVGSLKGCEYTVTGDYLEAGTFAIASLVTQGEITINGIETSQLDSFWEKLKEVDAKFEIKEDSATIYPSKHMQGVNMLRTAVYPSFATDLQAPFTVLLTQAEGESKIFETLFDGRLQYLFELEKMGAKVNVLNPHQAIVEGPTTLKGIPISSLDIRAGAAMVLAALCAEGTTQISNIYYINRGYENFDEKLRNLGANINRLEE
jgi:UDP-N-acetylglucosamine 1-carboxyvinyltransferase